MPVKKGYSGELIRETGEFGLSIVGEQLRGAALKCGRSSGRAENKAATYGVPLQRAEKISAEVVSGSRVVFECILSGSFDAGDHTVYLGEIMAVRGDERVAQLFAYDGYARLDTAANLEQNKTEI